MKKIETPAACGFSWNLNGDHKSLIRCKTAKAERLVQVAQQAYRNLWVDEGKATRMGGIIGERQG